MSLTHPKPHDDANPATGVHEPADQLAHELANLLDGSLRHLGIVMRSLREGGALAPDSPAEAVDPEALLARLQTTDRAMRQMVSLIHAWMGKASGPMELFDRGQTLEQMLTEVVRLHEPAAERYGISLRLVMDEAAAGLYAGPVFPVVANGIRNAIEAVSGDDGCRDDGALFIEVEAGVAGDMLTLTVRDNGPGLDASLVDADGVAELGVSTKGAGHGLGLSLSEQIARSLDGTLRLTRRDCGGCELILSCPVSSLTSPHLKGPHA